MRIPFTQAVARGAGAVVACILTVGLAACSLAYPLDGYAGPQGEAGDAAADALDPASFAVPGKVRCGADTCVTPDEVCCGVPGSFACTTASKCKQLPLACDDGADCAPGAVCCAFQDGGAVTGVRCAATSACPVAGGATVFCDPANPTACATGGSCRTASEAQLPRTSTYDECR